MLRLTDKACLVLNKYGQMVDIDKAIWYKCITFGPDNNNNDNDNIIITNN